MSTIKEAHRQSSGLDEEAGWVEEDIQVGDKDDFQIRRYRFLFLLLESSSLDSIELLLEFGMRFLI